MKHEYINPDLVHECKKKITYEFVQDEVVNKYHITNIMEDEDDEALYEICNALYEDYTIRNTNYHAYIEDGMNARVLMELRKSALFPFDSKEKANVFFRSYADCDTVEDIKAVRIGQVQAITKDYIEAGWQYYYLMKILLTDEGFKEFYFNFEQYFVDRDMSKWEPTEEYFTQFYNAHAPESLQIKPKTSIFVED